MVAPKIMLRPLNRSDLDAFLTWAGDPEVTKSLRWDHYTDRAVAEKFLIDIAEKHPWFMAICVDGVPVGAITLDHRSGEGACRAELGYVVARSHWGKGYATQAACLTLARGFSDLGLKRIEAFVDPDNIGSICVLEKAGMIREAMLRNYVLHRGRLRDRFLYAALAPRSEKVAELQTLTKMMV